MPFTYSFPFYFHVARPYRREMVLEVRDAGGRVVRRIGAWSGGSIKDALNEPSVLSLEVMASDASVEALSGGNEIWVQNQDGVIEGKYRLAAGSVSKSHAGGVALVSVEALSYTSLLGDEVTWNWEKTGTLAELVAELLARQANDVPVTAGAIPATLAAISRTIRVEDQQTMLETLRNLVDTIEQRAMFWVDNDRVLQWRDLSVEADSGKHLTAEKNLSSVEVEVDWSSWITRVFAYGEKSTTGRYLLLSDGAQGWSVFASSAGAGFAVLDHTHAGCSDPQDLTGYEGAVAGVQVGDRLKFGAAEVEIVTVTPGETSTTVTWRGTYSPGAAPGVCQLRRDYLDSPLYGCEFFKTILIDPKTFDARGASDYALEISITDEDVAALGAKAAGRTARVFFLADDGVTALSSVTTTLDVTDPAASPNLVATVTVPRASGVRETAIYMVVGWE